MTEARTSCSDLADRWRRFCEAMLGELRPETGGWWRSGAFWLLSWVMRRRMRREAALAAEMIKAMMDEVLGILEQVRTGTLPAVSEAGDRRPRGRETTTVTSGGAMDSGFRRNDGYTPTVAGGGAMDSGLRRNDGYTPTVTGGGAMDSGLCRNDGYTPTVAGGGAMDSGFRRNDGYEGPRAAPRGRPVQRQGTRKRQAGWLRAVDVVRFDLAPWARPPPALPG